MKQYYMTFVLGLIVTMATAQQYDYHKMSAWVRQAAQAAQTASRRAPQNEKRCMMAFVQTRTQQDADVLKQYGCRIYAQQDDISIASIPLRRLSALSQHPAVLRIEASQMAQTTMDTVTTVINALPVYTATSQHPAFTGRDVVVGVMDVGFDLTHPNFYSDATLSKYRIGAFWDQLSRDTIGSQLPVGRDFIGQQAILAQGCSTDSPTQSHGTHTAGVAAGSGYDTNYRGMAPESDICLVSNVVSSDIEYVDSADYYKYTSAVDALGFKYIFDYADQQGKPCVASFSEGYPPYLDQTDSLYSAFLEKLCGPGHIIVVAAGNENQAMTYADKPIGTAQAGSFISSGKEQAFYRIKSDGPTRLHILAYENSKSPTHTFSFDSADMQLDSLYTDTLYFANDTCSITYDRYTSALSKDTIYNILLQGTTTMNKMPRMAIVADGADSHIEIYGSSSYALSNRTDIDPRWNSAQHGHNIFAPGCFPSAICVGGTSHRLDFTNYKGKYFDYPSNEKQGKLFSASSTGPTMDGRMKPDVVAPGYLVISSYNSYYLEANPELWEFDYDVAHFEVNGRTYAWHANSGTSMSCPVVAGTIALWLQAKPTLTREEIIEVMSRTCKQPDDTLTYPNNSYGYGEIDAYRGLLDILGISKIEAVSQHQPKEAQVYAKDGRLYLQCTRTPASAITVSIYALSGKLEYQTKLKLTGTEATLALPSMASGIHAVQLSGSEEVCGSQLIRL